MSCPGTVLQTVTGAPPGAIAAVASGGTSYRVRVAQPVLVVPGSTCSV